MEIALVWAWNPFMLEQANRFLRNQSTPVLSTPIAMLAKNSTQTLPRMGKRSTRLISQGGQYRWAIRTPRMSASISAPGMDGIADTITVGKVGLADQAVSLLIAAKSEAKQVTIAIAGWSGKGEAQARWFELNNMMMEPNHVVTVQVNNGGQELLLQNSGPTVTFELQVHAGLSNQAVRSNVTIEAGKAVCIRPTSWSPETIATVPVLMDLMDKPAGHVVRQIIL